MVEELENLDRIKVKFIDVKGKIKDTELSRVQNNDNQETDKLRTLNLFSIYQRALTPNNFGNKVLYIFDKNLLNHYYYKEINDLLNTDPNINSNNFISKQNIEIILSELNFNKLKIIGKKINKITEVYKSSEIITLSTKNKVNIYKEFILIDEKLLKVFNFVFEIEIEKIEFKFIKNNSVLKINNDNQKIIFIGDLDLTKGEYNIKYILEYMNKDDLENHFKILEQRGIDDYIRQYKLFKNEGISNINNENNLKVGIAYKYEKNVKEYFLPCINSYFNSCPNLGLQNIGATCYMNSTLQCFCHIDKFVNYFKYNNEKSLTKDKHPLSSSFKELIENLWPNEIDPSKKDYPPKDFKETISKLNPLFEGIAANDAKDLVNFIIMTLSLELSDDKVSQFVEYSQIGNSSQNYLKEKFMKEFELNNNTIISKLFYGINYNITQCLKCSKKTYNYQLYFFLIFPLEEVRKYKHPDPPTQNNIMNANMSMSLNLCASNSQPMIVNQPYYNQFGFNQIPRSVSVGANNMNMMNMGNYMNNSYMMPQQGVYPNNFNQFPMGMSMQNQFNNSMMSFQMPNNNYVMPVQAPQQQMPLQQPQQQPQPQQNQNQNNINKNEVTIDECFEYYIKENIMDGDNIMYCQQCKSQQKSTMATKIEMFPEVLIIILNRGVGLEFDVKINFKKMIDLEKYIGEKKDNNGKKTEYDLIGVISHLGESSDAGHFIAYCRDPIKREDWYKYNDSFVTKVEEENFQKEVVDFGMPYVLFYQKH
jgi:ubiquitin C-terminal hydrolase